MFSVQWSRWYNGGVNAGPRISFPPDALARLCGEYGVKKLSLFGSVLRDDFRPDSDVDVLVEFEEGARTGFRVVSLELALSLLIGGRRVDLRTPDELSRYFRQQVVEGACTAYARA